MAKRKRPGGYKRRVRFVKRGRSGRRVRPVRIGYRR